MFWRRRKEGSASADPTNKQVSIIATRLSFDKAFETNVVGESNYQTALSRITGISSTDGIRKEVTALLLPEPTNRHDNNAVVVLVESQKVGYLSRDDAIEFHDAMTEIGRRGQPAVVDAVIQGGFELKDGTRAMFGVRLDLSFPFEAD